MPPATQTILGGAHSVVASAPLPRHESSSDRWLRENHPRDVDVFDDRKLREDEFAQRSLEELRLHKQREREAQRMEQQRLQQEQKLREERVLREESREVERLMREKRREDEEQRISREEQLRLRRDEEQRIRREEQLRLRWEDEQRKLRWEDEQRTLRWEEQRTLRWEEEQRKLRWEEDQRKLRVHHPSETQQRHSDCRPSSQSSLGLSSSSRALVRGYAGSQCEQRSAAFGDTAGRSPYAAPNHTVDEFQASLQRSLATQLRPHPFPRAECETSFRSGGDRGGQRPGTSVGIGFQERSSPSYSRPNTGVLGHRDLPVSGLAGTGSASENRFHQTAPSALGEDLGSGSAVDLNVTRWLTRPGDDFRESPPRSSHDSRIDSDGRTRVFAAPSRTQRPVPQ